MLLTEGQIRNYKGAALLIADLPKAKVMLGVRGYDADRFRHALVRHGIAACTPQKPIAKR